jgi:hypothetical protein
MNKKERIHNKPLHTTTRGVACEWKRWDKKEENEFTRFFYKKFVV